MSTATEPLSQIEDLGPRSSHLAAMGCGGSSEARYAASYEAVTGRSVASAGPREAPAPKAEEAPAAASQESTEDGVEPVEAVEDTEAQVLAWWSLHTDWIRDSGARHVAVS